MKTLQQQETEAILAMAAELESLKAINQRHLETASKIVQFVKENPPSYKQKVAEAPAHVGYES